MKDLDDKEMYCIKNYYTYEVVSESKKVQELVDNRKLNKPRDPEISVYLSIITKTVTNGVALEKQTKFDVRIPQRRYVR